VRGAYGANKAAMAEELGAIPREGAGVAIPGILILKAMREARPVLRLALDANFAARSTAYRESWCQDWITEHLAPLCEQLDPAQQHVLGEDFARHMDLTVLAPLAIAERAVRRCPFLVELSTVPTRQQEQILWYLIAHLPRFRKAAMDATGPGQTLAEYTADRFGASRIEQVQLNIAWYREHMVPFQAAFEDGLIDLPRDTDVENDLRALALIDGVIRLPKQRTTGVAGAATRHGDAAIAVALAYHASLQRAAPIEWTPAAAKSARWDGREDGGVDALTFKHGAW